MNCMRLLCSSVLISTGEALNLSGEVTAMPRRLRNGVHVRTLRIEVRVIDQSKSFGYLHDQYCQVSTRGRIRIRCSVRVSEHRNSP